MQFDLSDGALYEERCVMLGKWTPKLCVTAIGPCRAASWKLSGAVAESHQVTVGVSKYMRCRAAVQVKQYQDELASSTGAVLWAPLPCWVYMAACHWQACILINPVLADLEHPVRGWEGS